MRDVDAIKNASPLMCCFHHNFLKQMDFVGRKATLGEYRGQNCQILR